MKKEREKHSHKCYECGEDWEHVGLYSNENSLRHPKGKLCPDCRFERENFRENNFWEV